MVLASAPVSGWTGFAPLARYTGLRGKFVLNLPANFSSV